MTVLRVVEPFSVDSPLPRVYPAGALVHSSDPVVTKARAGFFVEAEEYADRSAKVVEQATAAPGELRTRTPAKKAAKKAAE